MRGNCGDRPGDREITFGLVMGGVFQALVLGMVAWCVYRVVTR